MDRSAEPPLESMGMPTQVRSHSKVNLGLAIGPARPDGYHGLTTVYQTLELHDLVTVEARPSTKDTSIALSSNSAFVPANPRNTAWRAAELALESMQITAEVQIHIEKRLPVRGGLGGGSANAVAALVGLERELQKHGIAPLGAPQRLALAAQIGSDVPLFLLGGGVRRQSLARQDVQRRADRSLPRRTCGPKAGPRLQSPQVRPARPASWVSAGGEAVSPFFASADSSRLRARERSVGDRHRVRPRRP